MTIDNKVENPTIPDFAEKKMRWQDSAEGRHQEHQKKV
jgi:hypothetical protein